jgi:hypothetical protein
VQSSDRVLLGAIGTYEARCRRCFDPTLSSTETAESSKARSKTEEILRPATAVETSAKSS